MSLSQALIANTYERSIFECQKDLATVVLSTEASGMKLIDKTSMQPVG